MRRYSGLVDNGLDIGISGLDILYSTAFPGPVQIVRQFKPHSETNQYAQYPAYHKNKGLSRTSQNGGESRKTTSIPGSITNPMSGICGYVGNNGLEDKRYRVFYLLNVAPCKSVLKNQKYKIVKGAI